MANTSGSIRDEHREANEDDNENEESEVGDAHFGRRGRGRGKKAGSDDKWSKTHCELLVTQVYQKNCYRSTPNTTISAKYTTLRNYVLAHRDFASFDKQKDWKAFQKNSKNCIKPFAPRKVNKF